MVQTGKKNKKRFYTEIRIITSPGILYFNNISAIADSKSDYDILTKMGYTDRKIKKIIRKQAIFFLGIPFLFGLAGCIFATIVYKTALMQNLLKNSIILYIPTSRITTQYYYKSLR